MAIRYGDVDRRAMLRYLGLGAPEYQCEGEGPDHARTFTARIVVDGVVRGEGTGTAKKIAEQEAAAAAYRALEASTAGDTTGAATAR